MSESTNDIVDYSNVKLQTSNYPLQVNNLSSGINDDNLESFTADFLFNMALICQQTNEFKKMIYYYPKGLIGR